MKKDKGIATANARINHVDENQLLTPVLTSLSVYARETVGIPLAIIVHLLSWNLKAFAV
jgi:hypothetical protein